MSTTPRTDNAWRRYNCAELPAPQELVKESSALETELAAASQAYDCAMAIHGTVLEDLAAEREKVRVLRSTLERRHDEQSYHCQYVEDALAAADGGSMSTTPTCGELSCDECNARTATLETELARLRAELAAVQAQHLHEIDELAAQAKIMNALRAEVERLKGLASWANTCIHHNDAERARYGHVCLVCTSTRAEKAEKLWKEFITLMEITEESDSGNAFNPNKISSCRAMDGKRLNEILIEARQIVF